MTYSTLKRSFLLTSILAATLSFSACSAPSNTSPQTVSAVHNIESTRASLIAFNDKFNDISANHDTEGLLSLYTPDALWIAPGVRPAAGYDEPRKTFSFLSENKGVLTHTVDHLHISEDGTQATMIGEAVIQVEAAGLDATGTYLFVLKRTNNEWKIVTDMFHQHTEK